jgi:hypothetical protein
LQFSKINLANNLNQRRHPELSGGCLLWFLFNYGKVALMIVIQCRLVKDFNADNADASNADPPVVGQVFRGFLVS